jgi:hypothetical protein
MPLKDDPIIAEIRETRHLISEEFEHDPQRIVKHYIELQKQEEIYRQHLKQAEEEPSLESLRVA